MTTENNFKYTIYWNRYIFMSTQHTKRLKFKMKLFYRGREIKKKRNLNKIKIQRETNSCYA